MPQTITKVRVSNCLLRNSARGLQSVYYCKLQRYCKERWERIASRQFLRGAKSMSRNNAQKLAQRCFSKLYYHRHLSPAKAARSGGSALQPADPSSGNFKVRVACDVCGMKTNIHLSFPAVPEPHKQQKALY
ncbi:hypothetical protein DIPPA_21951 [Diplonema papillatum]|nr:hypothetical protein DIPPA_21951 [Diplonema papillatum]